MHVKELKARVADDAYVVDPQQVAAALLRRWAQVSPPGARGRAARAPHPDR
jgi:hypothetical protein